jgi:threonine/homoserine/homoserine lactone efflux protein
MLAGATVVAAALWWAIVVVLAAGAGKKLRRPGVGKRIDVVTGVLLVGLGAFFGVA